MRKPYTWLSLALLLLLSAGCASHPQTIDRLPATQFASAELSVGSTYMSISRAPWPESRVDSASPAELASWLLADDPPTITGREIRSQHPGDGLSLTLYEAPVAQGGDICTSVAHVFNLARIAAPQINESAIEPFAYSRGRLYSEAETPDQCTTFLDGAYGFHANSDRDAADAVRLYRSLQLSIQRNETLNIICPGEGDCAQLLARIPLGRVRHVNKCEFADSCTRYQTDMIPGVGSLNIQIFGASRPTRVEVRTLPPSVS